MKCPFCKNIVYNYLCSNHLPIHVIIHVTFRENDLKYIKLSNQEYNIYFNKTSMTIYRHGSFILETTVDPSLTPENFEKKLKTYLTFL